MAKQQSRPDPRREPTGQSNLPPEAFDFDLDYDDDVLEERYDEDYRTKQEEWLRSIERQSRGKGKK